MKLQLGSKITVDEFTTDNEIMAYTATVVREVENGLYCVKADWNLVTYPVHVSRITK